MHTKVPSVHEAFGEIERLTRRHREEINMALLRSIGDKKEVIHGEEHEEIMLVERVGSVGLVKNTISFMGETVATLWTVITPQVSLPNWQETKPDWPNDQGEIPT